MKDRFDHLPPVRVSLNDLDWGNTSCQLRFGREISQRLAESLKRTGMRTPPLLAEGESGLFIVCGFERLRMWRELGREETVARIAPPEATAADLLLAAVEENLEERGLNLIEQAIALEKWMALCGEEAVGLDEENGLKPALRTRDKLLVLLGHKPGPAIAERLRTFRHLSTTAQIALAQGTLPEGAAATLLEFSAEEQDTLVWVMLALRFTAGMCRGFTRECLEICRREKIGVTALLQELGLVRHRPCSEGRTPSLTVGLPHKEPHSQTGGRSVCSSPTVREGIPQSKPDASQNRPPDASPQEIALLRKAALDKLHRRRFPILSGLERDFATRHAALGLGDEVRLHPPKDFEGDQYHLSIRVSNCAELEKAVRALVERLETRRDEIEELFHITWEPYKDEAGRKKDED